jgi:hypothetical protein
LILSAPHHRSAGERLPFHCNKPEKRPEVGEAEYSTRCLKAASTINIIGFLNKTVREDEN